MIALSLDEVAALVPGELRWAPGASTVTSVEIDSRRCGPGALFVAIGGGTAFVQDALAAGAAAALRPDDAHAALAALGGAVRARSRARVVAITGSTGKTSTKDILAALCAPHARIVAAEASHNNEVGLPLTLCRLEPETEICIVELGMRGLGQIRELARIARPDVGVVTMIGPAHLELLGTLENVARAKLELVDELPPGGTAVVPAGVPLVEALLVRDDIEVVRVGSGGSVRLRRSTPTDRGSLVEVEVDGRTVLLDSNLSQRHQAENAAVAVAAYVAAGLPLARVGDGAGAIELSRLRSQELPLAGGGLLLADCYNANPVSMQAALARLAEAGREARRVAVLGEMAELGADSAGYHRELGVAVARAGVDVLVAVGPLSRETVAGARAAGLDAEVHEVADATAAATLAPTLVAPGDVVLVKASRAVGLESVVEALAGVPG